MLLDDDADLELIADELDDDSDPVPGIPGLLLGQVSPKPYPINVYNLDNQKESGIAGTLYPDGRFELLPKLGARYLQELGVGGLPTRYWDDVTARFVAGVVVWDSVITGSIKHNLDEPHKRMWDASVTGEWPNNPPRAERIVNPEKARLAAQEAEESERWN